MLTPSQSVGGTICQEEELDTAAQTPLHLRAPCGRAQPESLLLRVIVR